MIFGYQKAPESAPKFDTSVLQTVRAIGVVVNRILTGKLNATGEVTLRDSETTTTVTDSRVTAGSFIGFDPLTADGATELVSGSMYVLDSDRKNGSFVITHSSGTDVRSFKYLIIG